MILYLIKVDTTPADAVYADARHLTDQSNASSEERMLATCLDIGIQTAFDFVIQCCRNGAHIKGENIEHVVKTALHRAGETTLCEDLEKLGMKLPKQQ